MASLTGSEVTSAFKKLDQFLRKAFESNFREQLEESSPGYGLAELIHARRGSISRIRLFLISNRNLRSKSKEIDVGSLGEIPVTYNVWDIAR